MAAAAQGRKFLWGLYVVMGLYALDEHAISTFKRLIDVGKRGRKPLRDKISLAVRPMKLEIVHGGSAGG